MNRFPIFAHLDFRRTPHILLGRPVRKTGLVLAAACAPSPGKSPLLIELLLLLQAMSGYTVSKATRKSYESGVDSHGRPMLPTHQDRLACLIADGRMMPAECSSFETLIRNGVLVARAALEAGMGAASNQCQGICASGKRCANNVAPGRMKYCGIHGA